MEPKIVAGIVIGVVVTVTLIVILVIWLRYNWFKSSSNGGLKIQVQARGSKSNRVFGGQADESDWTVESLQYYFTNIQLAQNVDLVGSGYSNPQGVLTLYSKDQELYDSFGYEQGVTDVSGGYQELVDKNFTHEPTLDLLEPTSYSYVLLNWMRPIRIRAFTITEDVTLYTRKGTQNSQVSTGTNEFTGYQTTVDNITSGPAETCVYLNNNGGSFLKLQRPVTVDPTKSQTLQLLVDVQAGLRGGTTVSEENTWSIVDSKGAGYIDIPILDMTAVLLEGNQTVIERRFRILTSALDNNPENPPQWDILLLVYTISDTPEEIYAVRFGVLVPEDLSALPEDAPRAVANVFFIELNGTTWQFLEYDRNVFLRNFVLQSSGTCEIQCKYQVCGDAQVMQNTNVYATVAYQEIISGELSA